MVRCRPVILRSRNCTKGPFGIDSASPQLASEAAFFGEAKAILKKIFGEIAYSCWLQKKLVEATIS